MPGLPLGKTMHVRLDVHGDYLVLLQVGSLAPPLFYISELPQYIIRVPYVQDIIS